MWVPDSSAPRRTCTPHKNRPSGSSFYKPYHNLLARELGDTLETCGPAWQELGGVGLWWVEKADPEPSVGRGHSSGCLEVTKGVALMWPAQEHLREEADKGLLLPLGLGMWWLVGENLWQSPSSQKQEGELFGLCIDEVQLLVVMSKSSRLCRSVHAPLPLLSCSIAPK